MACGHFKVYWTKLNLVIQTMDDIIDGIRTLINFAETIGQAESAAEEVMESIDMGKLIDTAMSVSNQRRNRPVESRKV